jgi:hypothetical protein
MDHVRVLTYCPVYTLDIEYCQTSFRIQRHFVGAEKSMELTLDSVFNPNHKSFLQRLYTTIF